MQSLWRILEQDGAVGLELAQRLDGWASEVLQCRADALDLIDDGERDNRGLDHFFGAVKARDRLEASLGSSDLYLVAVIDALFASFTAEVDSDWSLLVEPGPTAGNDWWWSRMPVSGPVRVEFEGLVSQGLLDRLRQS
jgi:hypothetical protein